MLGKQESQLTVVWLLDLNFRHSSITCQRSHAAQIRVLQNLRLVVAVGLVSLLLILRQNQASCSSLFCVWELKEEEQEEPTDIK